MSSDAAQRNRAGGALDPPPGQVLVAGDWHGDREWALSVIKRVPQLLSGEQTRLILHLGDFGIWPGVEGRRYLDSVSAVLDLVGAQLWFIDGNHEDFPQLAQMASGTVAHAFPQPPSWWAPADLARNDAHRERHQHIVDAVRPAYLMHGHLHRAYQRSGDFGYGPVQVTGLAADGSLRNFAVLDVESITWKLRRRGLLDVLARRTQRSAAAFAHLGAV